MYVTKASLSRSIESASDGMLILSLAWTEHLMKQQPEAGVAAEF